METRNNLVTAAAATSHGVLPLDVLFDVLVRLPAKEICRLRTVCRRWRSLTTDPIFVKAHAPGQPEPLIVLSYHAYGDPILHVKNLSGDVIKRVPIPSGQTLLCSHLDFICVGDCDRSRSCCLIDPATGAASRLLVNCFREQPHSWSYWKHDVRLDPAYSVFALGRVDSTGEYKMLMVSCTTYDEPGPDGEGNQRCHVLTVNGACRTRWRRIASPEFFVQMATMDSSVVVGGAVYYLAADSYVDELHDQMEALAESDSALDLIACFDFETEHWSTIPGPHLADDGNVVEDAKFHEYMDMWAMSALAELKGYLVLAHNNRRYSSRLDLWFLTNVENGLWVKEYSIQDPGPAIPVYEKFVKPLLLLDDGRIVFFLCTEGTLLLYDPMTKVFSEMETGVSEVALYTGSLLAECRTIQRMVAGV